MKVVCAIPSYNVESTIGWVVVQAKKFCDVVIVVNDGSVDDTARIAEDNGALVVSHKNNLGKGFALRTGFIRAKQLGADVLVNLDGDGQHDPDDIQNVIKPIVDGNADIVVGRRSTDEMPGYRRAGNVVLNLFTNLASGTRLKDTQSGFRAYSREVLESIDIGGSRMAVESEILISVSGGDWRIVEVPVKCFYSGLETSSTNPLAHMWGVFTHILIIVAERHPFTFLGIPSILGLTAGGILLLDVIFTFLKTSELAIGTLIISIMLIIVGMIGFMISLVLFVLSRILAKIQDRSQGFANVES